MGLRAPYHRVQDWFEQAKEDFLNKRFYLAFPRESKDPGYYIPDLSPAKEYATLTTIEHDYLVFERSNGSHYLRELNSSIQWKDIYAELKELLGESKIPSHDYCIETSGGILIFSDGSYLKKEMDAVPQTTLERKLKLQDFYYMHQSDRWDIVFNLNMNTSEMCILNSIERCILQLSTNTKRSSSWLQHIYVDMHGLYNQEDLIFPAREIQTALEKNEDMTLHRMIFNEK